jgi:hypothetical protein
MTASTLSILSAKWQFVEDHVTCGMRAKLQDRGKPAISVGTNHEHTHVTCSF